MISVTQSFTAVSPGITSSFAAQGGTAPYTFTVRPNGAGGVINSSSGLYTAPAAVSDDPKKLYDTIAATDSLGVVATSQILVGDALLLVCEIIQTELDLAQDRVYLWDQKIMQPTDSGLYVAVSVLNCKPFANTNSHAATSGLNSNQSLNMFAQLQIDVISRSSLARTRKEAVLLALNSDYAQQQQEANGFFIGKLPAGGQFVNLSGQDGAAIPYRFSIQVGLQYFYTITRAVDYINSFEPVSIDYSQS